MIADRRKALAGLAAGFGTLLTNANQSTAAIAPIIAPPIAIVA